MDIFFNKLDNILLPETLISNRLIYGDLFLEVIKYFISQKESYKAINPNEFLADFIKDCKPKRQKLGPIFAEMIKLIKEGKDISIDTEKLSEQLAHEENSETKKSIFNELIPDAQKKSEATEILLSKKKETNMFDK